MKKASTNFNEIEKKLAKLRALLSEGDDSVHAIQEVRSLQDDLEDIRNELLKSQIFPTLRHAIEQNEPSEIKKLFSEITLALKSRQV